MRLLVHASTVPAPAPGPRRAAYYNKVHGQELETPIQGGQTVPLPWPNTKYYRACEGWGGGRGRQAEPGARAWLPTRPADSRSAHARRTVPRRFLSYCLLPAGMVYALALTCFAVCLFSVPLALSQKR